MIEVSTPAAPIERLLSPFERFLRAEAAGGVALLAVTIIALVWANSNWSASYTTLWEIEVVAGAGSVRIEKPLLLWINDGLMAVFFLLVGLEIKRELLVGELSSLRRAALPAAAAIGGMAGPALVFLAFTSGTKHVGAWGVPMATDIAFAVGMLALLGQRVPTGLKVFLVALAIVDDLGAVAVVAVVYTEAIDYTTLISAGGVFVLLIIANRLGIRRLTPYVVLGLALWVFVLKSGVHATLAGVLLAATIPSRIKLSGGVFREKIDQTVRRLDADDTTKSVYASEPRQTAIHELEHAAEQAQAPLLKLEHLLLPWVTFLIMPVFALANAGVSFGDGFIESLTSRVTLGIAAGLFLGNQIGITLLTFIVTAIGWCQLPKGVTFKHVYGAACLAGIGFTMSLFIAGLAFDDPTSMQHAKVGIMLGSLASGALGMVVLWCLGPTPEGA